MKIILSALLLVTSAFAATANEKSSAHKNTDEVIATGTRIDPSKSESEVVLTISKEQIENGNFQNIGELLQAASKKPDLDLDLPTRESVQKLVALTSNREVMENVIEITASGIVNNVALQASDSVFEEERGPAYSEYLHYFRPKALLIVKKHFSAQNMEDGVVNIYRNIYTQQEVDILLEMVNSEAWTLWQKHQPEAVNGSMLVGNQLAKIVVPELMKLSEEALQQARDTETTVLKTPAK